MNPDAFPFAPVLAVPRDVEVLDLSRDYDPDFRPPSGYAIGRYDEARASSMYSTPLFAGGRNIHMGVDLWAPIGTPIRAFFAGSIYKLGVNPARGDYGPTLITRHELGDEILFALWGHLSSKSLEDWKIGDAFAKGAALAAVGAPDENGGWSPHLHFQLSREAPAVCDMPGVVSAADRAAALQKYPDPRLVLGPLYR